MSDVFAKISVYMQSKQNVDVVQKIVAHCLDMFSTEVANLGTNICGIKNENKNLLRLSFKTDLCCCLQGHCLPLKTCFKPLTLRNLYFSHTFNAGRNFGCILSLHSIL